MLLQRFIIIAFPAILTIGICLIPVVTNYSDETLAEQAAQQQFRWFLGHVVAGLAFAVAVVATSEIARYLSTCGTSRLPYIGLWFVIIGASLHIFGLGADGVGPLAVASAGGRVGDFFDGSSRLVPGLFIAGSATFGLGQMMEIVAAIRMGVLGGSSRFLIPAAGVAFVLFEAVPSGWGLYGVFLTAWLIYVPLALAVGRAREVAESTWSPAPR